MVLPHVGTRVSGGDGRALGALVEHLRSEVDRRRATTQVDGTAGRGIRRRSRRSWSSSTGGSSSSRRTPTRHGASPVDDLLRVLRDGASVGVVGAVAGGRSLLQPRWAGIAGSTLLLGRLDPLDLALAGLRAADVPTEPSARPRHPTRGPAGGAARHGRCRVSGGQVHPFGPRPTEGGAWRYRPLPERVDLPPTYRPDDDGTAHVTGGRVALGCRHGGHRPHGACACRARGGGTSSGWPTVTTRDWRGFLRGTAGCCSCAVRTGRGAPTRSASSPRRSPGRARRRRRDAGPAVAAVRSRGPRGARAP